MDQATESPVNAICAEEASSAHVFKGSKIAPALPPGHGNILLFAVMQ